MVEELGSGVRDVKVGDRVGWVMLKGGYAELAVIPADRLVPIPASVDDRTAAAILLQGMTAHFLLRDCYRVSQGEWILIHAAAGGVGLLMTQIAHRIGARIIGTTSTEEKAALAREAGANEIVLYTKEDFQAAARRITGGAGVSVVYDSVGKTTFDKSLDSLRPRGYMVLFGSSSGAVPPLDPQVLNRKGSLFLTRPTLGNYIGTREELLAACAGALRLGVERRAKGACGARVSARERGTGAHRSRGAEDDGEAVAHHLRTGTCTTRATCRRCFCFWCVLDCRWDHSTSAACPNPRRASHFKSLRDSPACASRVDARSRRVTQRIGALAHALEPTRVPGLFRPSSSIARFCQCR